MLWAVFFNPLHVWHRQHFEDLMVIEPSVLGTRLVINDPAMVKWILVDNAQNYIRDSLQQRILYRITGRSVFSAEGSDWKSQRQALAPFFSAKALEEYIPSIVNAANAAVNRIDSLGGRAFDLGHEMSTLTVDVIGRTLFEGQLNEPPENVALNIRQFSDRNGQVELGDLLGLPAWVPGVRRMMGWRATAQVRQRAKRILAEDGIADTQWKIGFLSALRATRDPQNGQLLDRRKLEDNISTLIGAGSDTVAVALTWAIFLLSHVPHVRAAIEAEIDTHVSNAELTTEMLGKLVWTRAVIEETMRLYPPAPMIGRMARGKDTFGGVHYPAGTTVLIAPWVLHRHARLWREPDVFLPERFLPGQREQIPRYAYLPFGAGPRGCLGMGFAMQEAVVALASLLKHMRFERADKRPIRLRQCITLQTAEPLLMRATPR